MINRIHANTLRATDPSQLVGNYSGMCRESFRIKDGVPVVIAAYNEEADLPATLVSLSRSTVPVAPIVVENGSKDRTEEFARTMGASVLSKPRPAKMSALQLGVELARDQNPTNTFMLFTDADSLVGPRWAEGMLRRRDMLQKQAAAVLCGGLVIAHGKSPLVDRLRTVNLAVKDSIRSITGEPPIARGSNMAIDFGPDTAPYDAYQELPSNLFYGEEQAICDVIAMAGGQVVAVLGSDVTVMTRGDRFSSIRECLESRLSHQARQEAYSSQYADFTPYFTE